MSRRSRSYTDRLRQPKPYRPPRTWPNWLATARLPALLAVAAEAGHLAAVLVEWPAAIARGVFHVLAAAALGVTAVRVYLTPTRRHLTLALAVAAMPPACWLVGSVIGLSPYDDYPAAAAAMLTAAELATTALLLALWRADTARRQAEATAARKRRQPQRQRT
jgi:hypothetical protein